MKRAFIVLIIILLILSLTACETQTGNNNQAEAPETKGKEVELTLYFGNEQYIQTGDDNLDKLLVEKRKIAINNKPIPEAAVEELMKGPQNQDMASVISSKVHLIGIEVSDNIAYVNFSGSNMSGGSMEESFLVDSIIMTLTELDNIQAVQFMVDGEKTETLMGHIYTLEPMGREDTVMEH